MLNKKQSHTCFILSLIVIFALTLGVRFFYLEQKSGMHMDETLSFTAADNSEGTNTTAYDPAHIYTGKEIKGKLLFSENSATTKDLLDDLWQIHKDNSGFYDHTCLYTLFLRLWFVGEGAWQGTDSIKKGVYLNFIFFVLSFALFYRLLRRLFPNDKDSPTLAFTLFAAFIGTGTISISLFIRPYQLQQTIFILLTLLFVYLWNAIKAHQKMNTLFNAFVITGALTLGFLSGYTTAPYIVLLGTALLTLLAYQKQRKDMGFLLLYLALAFGLTFACYNGYFTVFTGETMQLATKHSIEETSTLFTQLKDLLFNLSDLYDSFLFYAPIALIMDYMLVRAIIRYKTAPLPTLPLLVLGIAFIWTAIVLFLAPYKVLRYPSPAFPILCLFFPIVLPYMRKAERLILIAVLALLYLLGAVTATSVEDDFSGTRRHARDSIFSSAKIENLFLGNPIAFGKVTSRPELPVILFWDKRIIRPYAKVLPYTGDSQLYQFAFDENVPIQSYPHLFLITLDFQEVQPFLPKGYVILDTFSYGEMVFYELADNSDGRYDKDKVLFLKLN